MTTALAVETSLMELYRSEDGPLLASVLNSVSTAEAGFALGLLSSRVPERTLRHALNVREALREIPASPFMMNVDFVTLSRVAGLEPRKSSWVLPAVDELGAFEIEILGQGNLCYDIVVCADDKRSFFKPGPIAHDLVRPAALEIILSRRHLLPAVVGLVKDAGMVFNPRFYLTTEDWQYEHAAESFDDFADLF